LLESAAERDTRLAIVFGDELFDVAAAATSAFTRSASHSCSDAGARSGSPPSPDTRRSTTAVWTPIRSVITVSR
jgi:hypothetical protein